MEEHEKTLYRVFTFSGKKIELPSENKNKTFEKVNEESLKDLADEFKMLVQIYKFNMTETPANFTRLANYFKGMLTKSHVLGLLTDLEDVGIINGEYGDVGKGRAGRRYFVSSENLEEARNIYEKYVRPRETPEERIIHVPGIL